MSDTSRRKFIAAAGAGTAATAVAGGVTLATGGSAAAARPRPGTAKEAVVAYVENHRSDRLTILVGEREIEVRDRDLVTRILNAAGGN
ncbi:MULTISPECIES: hypothetical protein [Nocardioides]|uniref:Twin-arginine translocation signal domain-containing protein n=1 Tax=Nocardioides kribbensis TaxID=305517 RepID=A0ABV1NZ92_9ACTN|nr:MULTISPECIES: hypothetical protein [Nocardioides]KQP64714.1 hypothetical protein ASF47_12430 [Nocardioides sp. Leaf285]KQQ43725.1 hypothetical protein ASF50_07470 [Nocardioides sp. Leaf307]MBJ7527968.1 hypothetical protein [Nocardioides sp.]MCM3515499.1 hypothetical protein [Nocardioides sp. P86]